MEGKGLADRYKRYKAGTTKLVDWLAHTARQCQDVTGILPTLRASANAVKQAKSNRKKAPTNDSFKVYVSTSELEQLAGIVISSNVTIPEDILIVTKDVISGRQAAADFYASLDESDKSASDDKNSGHQHFIQVLRKIESDLQKAVKVQRQKKKSKPADKPKVTDEADGLNNLFSCLEVEEPSTTPLGTKPAEKKQKPLPKVEFQHKDSDDEETIFAAWCFLSDLKDLREYIKDVWRDYKAGKISFTTACLVTETGMWFMWHEQDKIIDTFDYLCNYWDYLNIFGLRGGMIDKTVVFWTRRHAGKQQITRESPTLDEDLKLLCPEGAMVLAPFQRWSPQNLNKNGEDTRQAELQLPMARAHRFGSTLLERVLPNINLLSSPAYSSDVFTAGLVILRESVDDRPMWMVAACQVYLEVLDIIGHNTGIGARSLSTRAEHVLAATQDCLSIYQKDSACKDVQILRNTEQMLKCYSQAALPVAENDSTVSKSKSIPALKLLQSLPLFPGYLQGMAEMQLSKTGVALCNHKFTVLATAHLYKAIQKAGYIDAEWRDMEYVVESLTKKKPLLWGADPFTGAAARHFGLDLGLKSSAFSQGKQPESPTFKFGPKMKRQHHFQQDVPYITNLFCPSLEEFDKKSRPQRSVDAALESLARLGKPSNEGTPGSMLHKKWTRTGKLTPSQLLYGFKEVLAADESTIKFDYTRFFFTCYKFLGALTLLPDQSMSVEDKQISALHPYKLVWHILWQAKNYASRGHDPAETMLFKSGKVLKDVVESEGDAGVRKAMEESSGNLPSPSHPASEQEDGVGDRVARTPPPEVVELYKSHDIPIFGLYNTRPQLLASHTEMQLVNQAAGFARQFCEYGIGGTSDMVDAALDVAAFREGQFTEADTEDMMKDEVEHLARTAQSLPPKRFETIFDNMLYSYPPKMKEYLLKRLAKEPRLIAKQQWELEEFGKVMTGHEPVPAGKRPKEQWED